MQTLKAADIFAEHYHLINLVDTGGFAEVWKATFRGKVVALKIFPVLDAEGVKNIEQEYHDQADLLHTNLLIPRYYGIYEGRPFLEMRFCSGGNASGKIGDCPESEIARCLHQVAGGLAYLHANDIVHQDIKPNNFLLDSDGNYYLADLGLSIKVRQTIQRYTQAKSSGSNSIPKATIGSTPPCYRAPELYERTIPAKQPVKSTDIWSLGASLFEMASSDVPFGDLGGILQLNNPTSPDLPALFSPGLNAIVKRCLAKETWDRPTAKELCECAEKYIRTGIWEELVKVIPEPEPPPPPLPPPTPIRKRLVIISLVTLLSIVLAWQFYVHATSSTVKNGNTNTQALSPSQTPSDSASMPVVPENAKGKDEVAGKQEPKTIEKKPGYDKREKITIKKDNQVVTKPSTDEDLNKFNNGTMEKPQPLNLTKQHKTK